MIKILLNLFHGIFHKIIKTKYEWYQNLVLEWQEEDYIIITYKDRRPNILGNLYAFDDKGNISLKSYDSYINMNILDDYVFIDNIKNTTLLKRYKEKEKKLEEIKAEKIKKDSYFFQEKLKEYRKELEKNENENYY